MFLVARKQDGKLFAIKKIKIPEQSFSGNEREKILISIEREIELLSSIRHENIVSLVGFRKEPEYSLLVIDYCHSSLDRVLAEKKTLNLRDLHKCIFSVLNALQFLHSQGIAHRDLKV